MDRFMVLLQTDCSSVPLTTNHRIVVPRGGSQQTIPAGHLGLGDDVLCANGVQIVTGVEHFYGDDDIYEIVLEPDANMGTFFFTDHQTGALLTRAKCWHANANRRGNSTRRSVVFPSGRFGVVVVVVAVMPVVVRIQKKGFASSPFMRQVLLTSKRKDVRGA